MGKESAAANQPIMFLQTAAHPGHFFRFDFFPKKVDFSCFVCRGTSRQHVWETSITTPPPLQMGGNMGVFAHVRSDTKPLKDHIPGYKHTTVSSGFLIARVFTRSFLLRPINMTQSLGHG